MQLDCACAGGWPPRRRVRPRRGYARAPHLNQVLNHLARLTDEVVTAAPYLDHVVGHESVTPRNQVQGTLAICRYQIRPVIKTPTPLDVEQNAVNTCSEATAGHRGRSGFVGYAPSCAVLSSLS